MDTHTLDLLEFDKIRAAGGRARPARWARRPRSASSRSATAPRSTTARRSRPRWSRPVAPASRPPFGGLHDIRPHVRRAQIGAMLEPEELAETVETLRALGNLDRWLAGSATSFPGWRPAPGRRRVLRRRHRHRGLPRQPGQGARHRQPPALGAAPRDRPGRGTDPGDPAADAPLARDQADPPLPQLHDGRPSLRLAGRQGPSRRDPGLGSAHQRQQRDGLHRADGDRGAVGPALVSPFPRGEGDPPDPPLAQRPGRHGGRLAAPDPGDHGRARPDPRQGPVQPGLPDVGPGPERGGTPRPPPGQASAARGHRPEGPRAACRRPGRGPRRRRRRRRRGAASRSAPSCRSTSTSASSSRSWS